MNFKEVVVATAGDWQEGEMKLVEVEGKKILLSKVQGLFYATAAKCTHYGGPLADGVLCGYRLTCPWHHAVFDVRGGELLEPPALDELEHYDVHVADERVVLTLPAPDQAGRSPASRRPKDRGLFAIIGAGAAANAAALVLREQQFMGNIVMITHENHLPYDRPNLSKDYLAGKADPSWMPLRSEEIYGMHDIDIKLNTRVTRLDVRHKHIELEAGHSLKYDKVLIASGGTPRRLSVPGADLENIFTLRSWSDADGLLEALRKDVHVVVIGGGFIGTEAAASLRERDVAVTLVERDQTLFQKTFGKEIGDLVCTLHQKNGVTFYLGRSVAGFGGNGRVQSVWLDNGEQIKADVAIVALGVTPTTPFVDGLKLYPDQSIVVDKHFYAGHDVYAAGDVARFPDWRSNDGIRIEHFRTAEQHGRIAGQNMAGHKVAYSSVPFFWTKQVGLNIRFVGHVVNWDEIIFDGDPESQKFIAYYVKEDKVYAAAGNKRDQEMAAIEEVMRAGLMPPVAVLRHEKVDWLSLLNAS